MKKILGLGMVGLLAVTILAVGLVAGCGVKTTSTSPKQSPAAAYESAAHASLSSSKYDKAIAQASRAIVLDPTSGEAYGTRAVAYICKNEYNKAIADANKAIEVDPDPTWKALAYDNLGSAYSGKGEYDKAIANISKEIELEPDVSADYVHRANIYKDAGHPEEAVPDFKKALELDPNNADARKGLRDLGVPGY